MTLGATCYLHETVAIVRRQLRLRKHRLRGGRGDRYPARQGEDGSGRNETFEHHKGVFLGRTPDEPNVLHGEIEQWAGMLREVRDESSVEGDKADERLDLLFVSRGRPLRHPTYLHWIHLNLVV